MGKEDAQRAYEEAYAAHQDSYGQLKAAREELDRYIAEEEAANRAVFMFGEGANRDERLVRAARDAAEYAQRVRAAADEGEGQDGPVGGLN